MADSHDAHAEQDEHFQPIGVLFQSRAEARTAIKALHKAKYTQTWLGMTSVAEKGGAEVLTVESGGFFSGTQSLVDALVSHGIHGDAARQLEGLVEPGNALLTIDPKHKDPAEALEIVAAHGGQTAETRSATEWAGWGETPGLADADLDMSDDEWDEVLYTRR